MYYACLGSLIKLKKTYLFSGFIKPSHLLGHPYIALVFTLPPPTQVLGLIHVVDGYIYLVCYSITFVGLILLAGLKIPLSERSVSVIT